MQKETKKTESQIFMDHVNDLTRMLESKYPEKKLENQVYTILCDVWTFGQITSEGK